MADVRSRPLLPASGESIAGKNEDRIHTIEVGGLIWTPARKPFLASLDTVAAATVNLVDTFQMSVHSPKISHLCRTRSMTRLPTLVLSLGLSGTPEPTAAQIVTERETMVA